MECCCCILVFNRSIGCNKRQEARPETAPEDRVVQVGIFFFVGGKVVRDVEAEELLEIVADDDGVAMMMMMMMMRCKPVLKFERVE